MPALFSASPQVLRQSEFGIRGHLAGSEAERLAALRRVRDQIDERLADWLRGR